MLRFLLYISLVFISSCATQVISIKKDGSVELQPNEGFFLLGMESNTSLRQITISGPQNIILTSEDLRRGASYLLVNLPAGTYTIDRIFFNYSYRMSLRDSDKWKFRISSNKVTYIGHFELAVKRRGGWPVAYTELVNRSSEALEIMEKNYPIIFQNNSMSYGGPGRDDFIDYITRKEG